MPEYHWKGIDFHGKKISGIFVAENKNAAHQFLQKECSVILSLQRNYHVIFQKSIRPKNILQFSEELLLLLQSGISLSDALFMQKTLCDHQQLSVLLETLHNEIHTGKSFSQALEKYPNYFTKHYRQMIHAGEQTGDITTVLNKIIQMLSQSVSIQKKIKKALFYPVMILVVAVLICFGLLIFVIPQFSKIYQNFGGKLPMMTQRMITISHLLIHHDIGLLFLSSFIIFLSVKSMYPKKIFFYILNFTAFRKIFFMQQIMLWTQMISMGLSAKIHLIDALTLANETILSSKTKQELEIVKNQVIAGDSLHHALMHCALFNKQTRYFIAIGENADALDIMMQKTAYYYQERFSDLLDHLSKIIEPVMMMIVASLVSSMIIAMYLPVFQMGNVL